MKEYLGQMSDKMGIDRNVKFLGQVSHWDLPYYYSICDIFVLSSVRESLGWVYIEAATRKKPIITTATVGAKELIKDSYNGFIVPLKDYRRMAAKIIFLAENRNLIDDMGENNFNYIKKLGYFVHYGQRMLKVKYMWERTLWEYSESRKEEVNSVYIKSN